MGGRFFNEVIDVIHIHKLKDFTPHCQENAPDFTEKCNEAIKDWHMKTCWLNLKKYNYGQRHKVICGHVAADPH